MSEVKFINYVAIYRKNRGLSQDMLASECNISRNTVSAIETGSWSPSARLAYKLCKALNCKFEDLFEEVTV